MESPFLVSARDVGAGDTDFDVVSTVSAGDQVSFLGDVNDADRFLKTGFGQTIVLFEGPNDRFDDVFGWNRLNALLQWHEISWPRLSMAERGKVLAPTEFMRIRTLGSGRSINYIDVREMRDILQTGGTLILNGVDELDHLVGAEVDGLGRFLGALLGANAYASFSDVPGFALHQDTHHTFILQTEGSKDWVVFEPSSIASTEVESYNSALAEDGKHVEGFERIQPTWEGKLKKGDVLYIPEGWWHMARASTEPALHLTVSVESLRPTEIVNWITARVSQSFESLPLVARMADESQLRSHEDLFREGLVKSLEANFLREYLCFRDISRLGRPSLGLPETITKVGSNLAGMTLFSSLRQPLRIRTVSSDILEIAGNGRVLRYRSSSEPMLVELLSGAGIRVDEFMRSYSTLATREELFAFIGELLHEGFVRYEDTGDQLSPSHHTGSAVDKTPSASRGEP